MNKKILLIAISLLTALTLSVGSAFAADEATGGDAKKTEVKKTKKTKKSSKAPKAPKTAPAEPVVPEEKAKTDLKTFAYDMTSKANKAYAFSKANPDIVTKDGKTVASYAAIDPTSIEVTLKPTKSADVPYVGVISYLETVYESAGADAKAAKKGNFAAVRATKMTEIYRYVNKKWVP